MLIIDPNAPEVLPRGTAAIAGCALCGERTEWVVPFRPRASRPSYVLTIYICPWCHEFGLPANGPGAKVTRRLEGGKDFEIYPHATIQGKHAGAGKCFICTEPTRRAVPFKRSATDPAFFFMFICNRDREALGERAPTPTVTTREVSS